ncbi:ATP-binding protein [Methylocella sp. CPCC 101449]|uniref:ATP-binding protein n=1 Tax=Methylocella sp. CPCC 101449 TaxID=2987531 RepID=UPI003908950B
MITNIIRHAQADTAQVHLSLSERALTMRVSDDGIGITSLDEEADTGNGLAGMRRRIAELGGTIHFEPTNRGTSIAVLLPLRAPARAGQRG